MFWSARLLLGRESGSNGETPRLGPDENTRSRTKEDLASIEEN